MYYPVINPNTGKEIWPDRTRVWSYTKDRHEENVANNLVYWGLMEGENLDLKSF